MFQRNGNRRAPELVSEFPMTARHLLEDLKGESRELQCALVDVEPLIVQHVACNRPLERTGCAVSRTRTTTSHEDEDEHDDEHEYATPSGRRNAPNN